jgi:DNA-directed RNA polymerase subunit RPC12/RpoP
MDRNRRDRLGPIGEARARAKRLTPPPPSRRGIPIRITKYRANCLKCGTEVTVYPRHIEHHEPIVCPSCGRKNSADEFDLRDQIATEQRELRKLFRRTG